MTSMQSQPKPSESSGPSFVIDAALKEGDQGSDVVRLQHLLNEKGANLSTDGDFNQHTKTAVKRFQQTHGLLPNGVVNAKTLAALLQNNEKVLLTNIAEAYNPHDSLNQVRTLDWLQHEIPIATMVEFNHRWADRLLPPEPLLYPGDRHKSVKELKELLLKQDSLVMIEHEAEIDTHFDPPTKVSVIRFQHQHNLTGDGIVGPLTWRSLRCPTRMVRLAKKLNSYRPTAHPSQRAALIWLQSQLSDTVLLEVSLRWHHQDAPAPTQ